jgi:hypothetical protein
LVCGYYNTESNWNTGNDWERGWDQVMIQHVRDLEKQIEQSVEIVKILVSAINSTSAYWGDALDREDYERVVKFLRRIGEDV